MNYARAHLTLALAQLPPPHLLPHQVCCPNSRTWEHIPTSHWAQSQPLSAKLTERGHSHLPSISCNGNQHYSSTFLKCHLLCSCLLPIRTYYICYLFTYLLTVLLILLTHFCTDLLSQNLSRISTLWMLCEQTQGLNK